MKTLKIFFPILFIVIACGGCSTARMQYRFTPPANENLSFTDASGVGSVTESEVDVKTGKSSSVSFLGLVSIGDSGNANAARDGEIDIIKTSQMDIVKLSIFGLAIYTEYTTTVTGN